MVETLLQRIATLVARRQLLRTAHAAGPTLERNRCEIALDDQSALFGSSFAQANMIFNLYGFMIDENT